MSNTTGWISIHRKIRDCETIWDDKPFSRGQAWIDLLLMVNHEDKKTLFDGNVVLVKRGQRITSIRKLCQAWGWSNTKVTKFLDVLETEQMITKKSDSKKTLITVINYDIYQNVELEKRHRNDTETSLKHTNNNDNNDNNDNKRERGKPKSSFTPPTVEEVRAYCEERKNNINPQQFIDFYASKGWIVGKVKMKDWKASVRTWERRTRGDPKSKIEIDEGFRKSFEDNEVIKF